jgi:hypothetical protein
MCFQLTTLCFQDNAFKSRLSSVGGGRCGYKIWNLEQNDTRDLTLFATDNQKRVYRNISHLVVTKGTILWHLDAFDE